MVLRLGVVLGREGGAFPSLARLARWFLGGAVGRGRQYISWLHLADAVRIYRDAIDREDFQGIYVAASPQPATNAQFMRELRAALHRPWSPPVPALAVRLGGWIAGINAELALTGQRCAPRRLMEQGFAYEFPELRRALRRVGWLGGHCFCPSGASENSPAIYRWVQDFNVLSSPRGTVEAHIGTFLIRPYGTLVLLHLRYPAINRWAIFNRPSGTGRVSSMYAISHICLAADSFVRKRHAAVRASLEQFPSPSSLG